MLVNIRMIISVNIRVGRGNFIIIILGNIKMKVNIFIVIILLNIRVGKFNFFIVILEDIKVEIYIFIVIILVNFGGEIINFINLGSMLFNIF